MSELLFSVRPAMMPALLPHFLKWLWRYAVAGILAYFLFLGLGSLGVVQVYRPALMTAVIVVAIVLAVVSVKHRAIRLHRTKYVFYDTHVVREQSLIAVRRQSLPYAQISKVTNNSSLWNRIAGASDIILHTSKHDSSHDLVLNSVRDSDGVEQRIYKLLKQGRDQ